MTTTCAERLEGVAGISCAADRIGAQLHVGAMRLSRATFVPMRNHDDPAVTKPHGGMWSATLQPGPRSSFTDIVRGNGLWWVVEPDPEARILIVDSPRDWQFLIRYYRRPDGPGPDYERLAADGFVGVHLTDRGVRDETGSKNWEHESTVWLRWAFLIDPAVSIPRGPRRMANREYLPAPYQDIWVVWTEPSDAVVMAYKDAMYRPDGGTSEDLVTIVRALLDTMVCDHGIYQLPHYAAMIARMPGVPGLPRLPDSRRKLPVGSGFFDALIRIDSALVIAIVELLARILATRRQWNWAP